MKDPVLKDFYLVGGTGLSLQLGHRISSDIDLFSHKPFNPEKLTRHMERNYDVDIQQTFQHGLICYTQLAKVDFQHYPWGPIKPVKEIGEIRMLGLEDIAAMKLNAITIDKKRIKDFVDIAFLLEKRPLDEWLDHFIKKYPDLNPNEARLSVGYHLEIDFSNLYTLMNKTISWEQIATRLKEAVNKPSKLFQSFSKPLLQKKREQHKKGGPKL
jgi:hypothetical protein